MTIDQYNHEIGRPSLKPCPFCGEDMPPHDDTSWVRCFGCGVETGWQPTGEEAISAWNRRANAAVPAQVRVKPLDISNALKHAFISGRVSAGAASSFHADAWVEYDPTESAAYARILAALEPQPDPRNDVITQLVEALEMAKVWLDYDGRYDMQGVNAALTVAKAVQHG